MYLVFDWLETYTNTLLVVLRQGLSVEISLQFNMQTLTALLLVPLVALIIGIEESSGKDAAAKRPLFSEEAKNTMKELHKYLDKIDESFDAFGNQLKQENNVKESLKQYKELYDASKKTKCQRKKIPIDDDEDLVVSLIDDCVNSLPVDKLSAFHKKIKVSKAKVKVIDETLQKNAETCDSNPTTCEENKKKALKDLNSILSPEAKADFENEAHKVLTHAKNYLEECFIDESDELLEDIQEATTYIADCLSTLSK